MFLIIVIVSCNGGDYSLVKLNEVNPIPINVTESKPSADSPMFKMVLESRP